MLNFIHFLSYALVFLFFYYTYKIIRGFFLKDGRISKAGAMICPSCGTQGDPTTITKGSLGVEILLWICFLVPGLIYSVWRTSTRYKACPSCQHAPMLGINTPNGKILAEKFSNS